MPNIESMEKEGGPCPQCGKQWRKKGVKNRFVKFDYYEPTCDCNHKCTICGAIVEKEYCICEWREQIEVTKQAGSIEEYKKSRVY